MSDDVPPSIPAATLILLRDCVGGPPEMLMVERSSRMAFAPGALVFPGGRIDPGDHALAGAMGDEGAARIAAIRETAEETGLLVAMDLPVGARSSLAASLANGAGFADALAGAGATTRPDLLLPFARWMPPEDVSRRFDTRFYLARAPDGLPEPIADGTETRRAFWTRADEVLARVGARSATMIFPTRRTVERLALFGSVDAAFAHTRAHPIRTVAPWTEQRGGEPWLCIPDDLGFPVTAQRVSELVRG